MWCWGGTYRGPKAFRHTYTHIAKHIETTVVRTFNRAYVKVDSLERFLSRLQAFPPQADSAHLLFRKFRVEKSVAARLENG